MEGREGAPRPGEGEYQTGVLLDERKVGGLVRADEDVLEEGRQARISEARRQIDFVVPPDAPVPVSDIDTTPGGEAVRESSSKAKEKPKSSHSFRNRLVAAGVVVAGVVGGWAKGWFGGDTEAKGRGVVAERDVPTPTTLPELPAVTPTTIPEAKTTLPKVQETTKSTEVWKEAYREFTIEEKMALERSSGFGLSKLKIGEIDRIQTANGEVVVAGIDGAKPSISKFELVKSLQLADEQSQVGMEYSFTLPLDSKTSIDVSYTVGASTRQRIFIYAGEGQSLAYPIFSDPKVKDPLAFTTKNKPGSDAPSVSLVGTRPNTNRADGIIENKVVAYTEVCQASQSTKIAQKAIDEAWAKRQSLRSLPSWVPSPTFESQLEVLAYLAQESKCNGFGADVEAASRQESFARHQKATELWTLEGILPGVGVPYGLAGNAEYEAMLRAFRR